MITDDFRIKRGATANIPSLEPGELCHDKDLDEIVVGSATGNRRIGSHAFRNRIIGGDFSTNPWQRGATITAPSNADYLADRFLIWKSGDMVVDVKKTSDGPTFAQAGYLSPYCLHVDVTTADTSVASGDLLAILQIIEGYNIADLGFGHTDTKYVTLSFWVKATKTGTYCCGIMSADYNAAYIAEYTISASSTWQKVEITIPTESTYGYYDPGSQSGLNVFFTIVAGSDFQNSGNTWIHVGVLPTLATSNQVNGVDSMSNDFKLALIQLEPGNVATPFEFRPAAVERQLCQRYFWRGLPGEHFTQFTTAADQYVSWPIKFPVTMRDVPTVTYDGETLHSFSDLWVNVPTVDGCRLIAKSSGANASAYVEFSSSGYIEADAEL